MSYPTSYAAGIEAAARVCEAYGNDQMALVIRNDLGSALAPERGGGSEPAPPAAPSGWVETLARTICRANGRDPDGFDATLICNRDNEPLPLWQYYDEEAIALLKGPLASWTPPGGAETRIRELEGEVAASKNTIQFWMTKDVKLREDYYRLEARADRLTTAAQAARDALEPFPMQDGPPIPRCTAEIIYEVYAAMFGRSQTLDRLGERCGFGWGEIKHIFEEARKYKPEVRKAALTRKPAALASLASVLDQDRGGNG